MIADEEASLINVVVLVEDGEATEEEGRQIDELHKCCWYSVGLSVGWLAGWLEQQWWTTVPKIIPVFLVSTQLTIIGFFSPSIAEGQDHNFLRHRRTHVKLPTPTTSPSAAFATIVVAIRSFLCRCCRRTQLPRPPRSSFKSSSVTVALSFLKFHRQCRKLHDLHRASCSNLQAENFSLKSTAIEHIVRDRYLSVYNESFDRQNQADPSSHRNIGKKCSEIGRIDLRGGLRYRDLGLLRLLLLLLLRRPLPRSPWLRARPPRRRYRPPRPTRPWQASIWHGSAPLEGLLLEGVEAVLIRTGGRLMPTVALVVRDLLQDVIGVG
ncbi:hypothetical protein GW17_00010255 [Ensete ventricosum]|nr:hypothetical protein GW17_00010255 [Ensete ventricosum]